MRLAALLSRRSVIAGEGVSAPCFLRMHGRLFASREAAAGNICMNFEKCS
jgi:hypothetical protein